MQINNPKTILLKSLAKIISSKRGDKSKFALACENDISVSIISTIERGLKDPQLTTIFKLSEALNLKASELVKLIEDELPKDFSLIDK